MTAEVTTGSTTVAQTAPSGVFKRRKMRSSPPVVIEVRIDMNDGSKSAPSAPKLAQAIEAAAGGQRTTGFPLLIEKVGSAVGDRVDAAIGMAGSSLEQRIDEVINGVNSQIDQLVESAVNEAVNTVVHRVIEDRLGNMLGEATIDLTETEGAAQTPTTQGVRPADG